jgi:hypothetical protein
LARNQSTGFVSGVRGGLTIEIEEKGLDEMIEKLQKYARIGDTDAKRVRWGMNQTVKMVFAQAKVTTPVRTGKMAESLFQKVKVWGEGNVTGNVGVGIRHVYPFVLEGGRSPAAKRGEIVPRRFLYHAYARVKDDVDGVWAKVLKLITEDLAKRG